MHFAIGIYHKYIVNEVSVFFANMGNHSIEPFPTLFSALEETSLRLTFTSEAIAFEIVDMKLIDPVIFSSLITGVIPDSVVQLMFLFIMLGPVIICPDVADAVMEIEYQVNRAPRITKERGIKF